MARPLCVPNPGRQLFPPGLQVETCCRLGPARATLNTHRNPPGEKRGVPPRAHAQCGAAAASSRKKALGPSRGRLAGPAGDTQEALGAWPQLPALHLWLHSPLHPAVARSSPCPEGALRGQPGGHTLEVRWLVAVVPSSLAASWPELGPRGHSCRSHSTTRVLRAEPASCLAEGLRERRLPARGAEAGTCTCLGSSPHTGARAPPAASGRCWAPVGSRKALAQQSSHQPQPGATPPAHTACPGPPAYLEARVASLEASQEAGTGRAPGGAAQPSCALAASGPHPGDHSPQAPAWGQRGPWEEAGGAPQRGERTLAAASPTRSEVRHYVLSYTKLFLGVLVNTNYTWLQVKIFILSQCFPGVCGTFSVFTVLRCEDQPLPPACPRRWAAALRPGSRPRAEGPAQHAGWVRAS